MPTSLVDKDRMVGEPSSAVWGDADCRWRSRPAGSTDGQGRSRLGMGCRGRIEAAQSNPFGGPPREAQDGPLRQAQDGIERLRTILRNPKSGEPRITVNSRCQALIREFGSYRYHEPREHHPISEQPIDAENHAIRALCYRLYDRFGVVRPRGAPWSLCFDLGGDLLFQ